MSTRSAESRSHSPDGSPEKRVSKKRKVLSCYACRNRKMKCDRVYPVCGRCQRTGRADQCTYDPRLLEDLPMNGDGHVEAGVGVAFAVQSEHGRNETLSGSIQADSLTWTLRAQERRLELLERKLAKSDGSQDPFSNAPSHMPDFDWQEAEPKISEAIMFRGKGFKTQFYGSTSPLSIINQFNVLQSFTREAMAIDTSMARIRNDFKGFRNKRKAMLKEKGQLYQGTDAEITALVPEKVILDPYVAFYFQNFETSYRILHEPTFWKDYHLFWDRQQDNEPPSSFTTILVLITAITKSVCTERETLFIGDSSVERAESSNLIDACDIWLSRQSRKHLTLAFFQLHCLSLLAKRVNCVKMKQDWVNSGDMIRLGMAAGMHRNSDLLAGGRISEFEKEMKRRIWATMMELELQSSIDSGLQSSLSGLYFDTQPPANIIDEMVSPESTQAPVGRPLEFFTPTSYLSFSIKYLPLRIHLTQLLNNPTTDLQYSDVLHYDTQINQLLTSLPSWKDPRSTIPSALLDLQLRQFILMLHYPYAKLAASNSRFGFSFTACVNAANSILSVYENFISESIFTVNHFRNDIFRTGMTIAQIVYHNSTFASAPETTNILTPTSSTNAPDAAGPNNSPKHEIKIPQLPETNFMAKILCQSSIELMERALSVFENKVMRLGTGYMEYWIMSAAIGIMPSLSPSASQLTYAEDIRSRGHKAIDRITRLCFRVLALQKDPGSDFASSLRGTMATASPPEPRLSVVVPPGGLTPLSSEISIPSVTSVERIPGAGGLAQPLGGGGISGQGQVAWDGLQDMQVDMSGWTFPDIWAFDISGDF
ncbi:hypothetical protein CC78DRAFT_491947 [Lojkania enalia]|uniref:Zn(2)-C6 fungal-type domain-containing protein n=1 Tax=Lojkania enalia TaxID=147567 RepID=A0A9P4KCT7_9PLEO|nr:hypothetical protein CC78DRAFT_491947 [Didymosphaeria enalia]